MGLQIFEASGTFSPSDHGLKAGDMLEIICVGGGSSGAVVESPSVAGTASAFGAAVSSASGTIMGKGGAAIQASDDTYCCGGGAGGYLPGVGGYGGSGGYGRNATICGMAGGVFGKAVSPWANPAGPGNKGAGGGSTQDHAPGGNGYGAGGGGAGIQIYAQPGGDAGKIAIGTVKLASTDGITVTVGAGGVNSANANVSGAPGVVLVFW